MDRIRLQANSLLDKVVDGGYCVGCGACAAVGGSFLRMELDELGLFKPEWSKAPVPEALEADLAALCPFSDRCLDEHQIGRQLYQGLGMFDRKLGYYRSVYAGFVIEGDFRERGSSGGVARWVLCNLLGKGMIDAVVQVVPSLPSEAEGLLFQYQITASMDDVKKGARSAYYPVEMSRVLRMIEDKPGVYAVVGLPCFIKAIRLLSSRYPVFAERVRFCIGLVCGHLKSSRYAEMLAWQLGILPGQLMGIDFRLKLPGRKASEKGIEIIGFRDDKKVKATKVGRELFGADYNYGFLKYKACDYCDDVFAETADLALGDAWLPQYLQDGKGTNILIVRCPEIDGLLKREMAKGNLHLDRLDPRWAVKSQQAAIRHRREGLSYRLYLAEKAGIWHPPKRVKPRFNHIGQQRRYIYELRMKMAEESHTAFAQARKEGDFQVFQSRMEGFIFEYKRLYRSAFPLHKRLESLLRRSFHLLRELVVGRTTH